MNKYSPQVLMKKGLISKLQAKIQEGLVDICEVTDPNDKRLMVGQRTGVYTGDYTNTVQFFNVAKNVKFENGKAKRFDEYENVNLMLDKDGNFLRIIIEMGKDYLLNIYADHWDLVKSTEVELL